MKSPKQVLLVVTVAVLICKFSGNEAYSAISMFDKPEAIASEITTTILNKAVPEADLLAKNGCYVWQQPGAALVITSVWEETDPVELYFNPEKLKKFLLDIRNGKWGEPFIHPPEPENADEFYIEPQVYLLFGKPSQSRLSEYMKGYNMWIELNEGAEFIMPTDEALLTDLAIVYIDSSGPLEFHFRLEDGKYRLQHLFLWDFFSA